MGSGVSKPSEPEAPRRTTSSFGLFATKLVKPPKGLRTRRAHLSSLNPSSPNYYSEQQLGFSSQKTIRNNSEIVFIGMLSDLEETAFPYLYEGMKLAEKIEYLSVESQPDVSDVSKHDKRDLHKSLGGLFTYLKAKTFNKTLREKAFEGFVEVNKTAAEYAFLGEEATHAVIKPQESLEEEQRNEVQLMDELLNVMKDQERAKSSFVKKQLFSENKILCSAVKGNQNDNLTNHISVDYGVYFNEELRITVLTEGEGPFAAEVDTRLTQLSNYCNHELSRLFLEKQLENPMDLPRSVRESFHSLMASLESDEERPFDTVLTGCGGKALLRQR